MNQPYGTSASRHSVLSAGSQNRPSIITSLSHDGSDGQSRMSYRAPSPLDHHEDGTEREHPLAPSDRALAWRNRGRATAMLRTTSDGADVVLEEGGMEWEVVNPHGTGKGHGQETDKALVRR